MAPLPIPVSIISALSDTSALSEPFGQGIAHNAPTVLRPPAQHITSQG
jgi:hypothetical protein